MSASLCLLLTLGAPPPTTAIEAERPSAGASDGASDGPGDGPSVAETPKVSALRSWLTRELPTSARFLDHGTLTVGVAAGAPHLYRVELGIGVLDHLSLGVTASWLPEDARPRWSPRVAVAAYRARWWEFGFRYAQVLHRRPIEDEDPNTPDFRERSHYVFGTASFYRPWFNAGLDVGIVHTRDLPLGLDADPPPEAGSYRERFLPAGGVFFRFGNRRWGFTLQGEMPVYTVELAFDLRFGLFEMRPRGGWSSAR